MAATAWESVKSRGSNRGRDATSRVLKWFVKDAVDEIEADALVSGIVPSAYFGLPLESIETDEIIAGLIYEVTVNYARPKKNREVGLVAIEFDTGGGKHKITTSLETVLKKAIDGKTAPDQKGAINVQGKNVEGVEIVLPALKFSMTAVLPFDEVTLDYVKSLAAMTGTTNGSPIFGYEQGELLFLGASGSTRKNSDEQPGVEIKFSFEASQNATSLTIGDISDIDKAGHDYLWVLHRDEADKTAKFTVKPPLAVYVERVYYPSDFSALNIPEE